MTLAVQFIIFSLLCWVAVMSLPGACAPAQGAGIWSASLTDMHWILAAESFHWQRETSDYDSVFEGSRQDFNLCQ